MEPSAFLIILTISLALLIVAILKFKVHPVLALFVTALGMGVAFGIPVLETVKLITEGFGATLTGVGITIILGAILAMGIQDIKATDSISHFFNKLFKGKRMELAPSLTAFVVSIPVFGDITMILLAPIASKIAHLKKISMATMASFTGLALFLTHSLVPPTPGVLATSLTLGADLGFVILWGIIVSLVAFFGTWLLLRKWTEKEYIAPLQKFIGEGDEDPSLQKKEIAAALQSEEASDVPILKTKLPPFSLAFLPILLPVIFIASASVGNVYMEKGTFIHSTLTILGDKVLALFMGLLIVALLAVFYKQNVYASAMANDKDISTKTPFSSILLNSWVSRGLLVAILPLLITAMAGSMGNIIKANKAVEELANSIAATNILPVLIPYLLAAVLMFAVGSMTMSALTSAAIIAPMMPILGLSPELVVLAIGAGALAFNHLNNSGFWIMSQFFNLTTKQGLKYITVPCLVGSVMALLTLIVISSLGFI